MFISLNFLYPQKDGSSVLNSKAISSNLSTASSNLEVVICTYIYVLLNLEYHIKGEDKVKCNQSDELVAEVTLTTAKVSYGI